MYYLVWIIIIIFLVICLYYAIKDINKLSKKLDQKIIDSNIKKQVDEKRFLKRYTVALCKELERLRFLNKSMKKNYYKK